MIQKFERSVRRILTFPAVPPCEGISPITLLESLVNLSRNICNFQSKSFPSQRRNSREAIRQIRILLIFFEEILERELILPDSVLLCFSELHITFQKILFLIEDLCREGAKVWMLLKSEFVASQFHVLIRAVATALDVLPLELIDVCGEVKELVDLVAKQAWKARFELDKDDDRAADQVLWTLNLFEKTIKPNTRALKLVLDHLQIKSWSDCNKEVTFLEEEISFESPDWNEREVNLMSSLVGLLCYCRGVIFETMDYQNNDQTDVRLQTETLSCLNPEDFRCPISLELMTDPVTVSTGQTYDRASIQKWFKAGNLICPKTGEKLSNTELVPNTTLRKLIKQFCVDNGISLAKSGSRSRDITRTIVPGSPAASGAIRCLSKFLAKRLVFGTSEQKNRAAYEIRLLAKSNIFNRSCLIEAGAIEPLLDLVSSTDKFTQENALSALLKLAKHASGRKLIIENGGLRPILSVLRTGLSLEARQLAAAIIFYLSSLKGSKKTIGEMPEAIPDLVELIKNGTTCGKKNAVVAIFGLLLYPGNYKKVLSAGTAPLLVDIISSSDKDELISDSLAVLARLAESVEGTFAILQTPALPLITGFLRSLTSRAAKEYCVSILLSLSTNGGQEVIATLAKDPLLMASLYSLLTDGTAHARKKARPLIKSLHEFHEASPSGMMNSAVQHGQSVHVW